MVEDGSRAARAARMVAGRAVAAWVVAAATMAAGVVPLWAAPPATPKASSSKVVLGRRYYDSLRGYSFCPPADTERIREFTTARPQVSWVYRDEKTSAIVWTLQVTQATQNSKQINLAKFSKVLAETLKRDENFQIQTVEVAPVANKPAIHLAGLAQGELQLWQRQVWVLIRPQQFLIFRISGPKDGQKMLDSICEAVADSLQVTDPKKVLAERKKNLARGQDLLEEVIGEKRMAEALRPGPTWYLLHFKGKAVGFMRVVEGAKNLNGRDGIGVRSWAMIELPKTPPRIARTETFVSNDGKLERWRKQWQVGSGKTAQNGAEDGLTQNDVIVCNVEVGDRIRTFKKHLPPGGIYLPKTIGLLLPRLVNLTKNVAYGFATYTTSVNAFDMRTFTVLGKQSVTLNGAAVQAVHVTDQLAADAAPANEWLSPKGDLLRMRTADGLVMESATERAVLAVYPKANKLVRAMGK